MLLGGLVSVAAAVGISAIIGPPTPPRPEAAALEVPPGSEFQERREDRAANVPEPLPQPEPGAPPAVEAPEPDTLDTMRGTDTDPAAQPRTGAPEDELAAPPTQGQRGRVEVATDAPVLPSPQATLPVAPEAEEGVSVTTAPAAPDPAPAPEEQVAATTQEPAAPVAGATQDAAEPAAESGPETPAQAATEDTAPAPEIADVAPEMTAPPTDETPIEEPAPAEEEVAVATPQETPEPATPEVAEAEPAAPTQPGDEAAPEAEASTEPPAPEAERRPSIGTPAQTLANREDGGRVSARLPSVGTAEDPAPEAAAPQAADDGDGQPPIIRNAAAFENPENKPLMSIVLIDNGDFSSAVDALASFPYPISFAVDPMREGVDAVIKRYREAGFEVLALTDIPASAAATDVEVNMAAMLARMPDAVAVMEGEGDGLQSSRAISDQVTAYLRDSGYGLVMFPAGLDTARKLAEKEGVPATTLFRDFDAKGQDATVIRRFLDQAAFKAAQEEGGVVMVGRARPETISALILWGLADRADRVALAPVSAVLRARAGLEPQVRAAE
jgi:polysaccharide deacetylase 2 family uncharacterized protein YibQ